MNVPAAHYGYEPAQQSAPYSHAYYGGYEPAQQSAQFLHAPYNHAGGGSQVWQDRDTGEQQNLSVSRGSARGVQDSEWRLNPSRLGIDPDWKFTPSRRNHHSFSEESEVLCSCLASNPLKRSDAGSVCNGESEKQGASDVEPAERWLRPAAWLPQWARPRLVTYLAHDFASQNKALPLRTVAGAAIPWLVRVTASRIWFGITFVVLVREGTACSADGFPHYHWVIWMAWLPFQILVSLTELHCFSLIAIPKIQVLNVPSMFGIKWPFYCWLLKQLILSAIGSLDSASDAAFLGMQSRAHTCSEGARLQSTWESLWDDSALGKMGLDFLIPNFLITCLIAWILNFVPITMAFISTTPSDYCIGSSVDYEIAYTADPTAAKMIGHFIEFSSSDLRKVEQEWHLDYETVKWCGSSGGMQNHGAALMSLAEVNSFQCIVFEDFDFAMFKAQDLLRKARSNRSDGDMGSLIGAYIGSQTSRMTLRTISGAFTNGLQLHLQMTALAMLQYNKPRNSETFQSLFSVGLTTLLLFMRITDAINVLWTTHEWVGNLSELDPNGPHSSKLEWSIRKLGAAVAVCCAIVAYGVCKLTMIAYCPYSLWNINGCWKPHANSTNFPMQRNSTDA